MTPPGGKRASEGFSLAALAYTQIKEQILSNRLYPGEVVAAHTLAEIYGMSRSPVNQALTVLANEGLVRAVPRVGYVISPISVSDVKEVFQLRLRLEGLAAELAAHAATPADIELFAITEREIQERAASLVVGDATFVRLSIETHTRFHLMVARLSGNNRLVEIICRLLEDSQRIQAVDPRFHNHLGLLDGAHRLVVEGLAAADPQAAKEAMETHIQGGQERVLRGLMTGPDQGQAPSGR